MLKQILAGACIIILSGSAISNAQCVPDLSITIPGVYPDSATGLPAGTVGIAYSEVIQVRVLTDTVWQSLPVNITSITVTSVTGLPPGLTYACNPASCIFPGGSNGCILLSGTPTTAGSYPVDVDIEIAGTVFGVPAPPQAQTISYYVILINQNTGLPSDISDVKFELLPNKPNPADNYTDVLFSSPISGDFTLKIFNLIGKEVYHQVIRGMAGINTTRVETSEFTPGVYMISIENGSGLVSRRMIVSRK